MRLGLTRRGDYGVRTMLALTYVDTRARPGPRTSPFSVARIAESEAIPPRILPSVMACLVRAGLIEAQEGRSGGYRLARPANAISLLEIVEAIEGDTRRRTCVLRDVQCLATGQCAVHGVFVAAQEALRTTLVASMLDAMERAHCRLGRASVPR